MLWGSVLCRYLERAVFGRGYVEYEGFEVGLFYFVGDSFGGVGDFCLGSWCWDGIKSVEVYERVIFVKGLGSGGFRLLCDL